MRQEDQVHYRAFQYCSRLKRVKEHVDQYYSEEISLEKAARIAATERTYFSTFFRRAIKLMVKKLQKVAVGRVVCCYEAGRVDMSFSVGCRNWAWNVRWLRPRGPRNGQELESRPIEEMRWS